LRRQDSGDVVIDIISVLFLEHMIVERILFYNASCCEIASYGSSVHSQMP
jgi:hypothetical protein